MTTAERMTQLGEQSIRVRRERREYRRGIQTGEIRLHDVIADVPDVLGPLLIMDVLRMRYANPGRLKGLARLNGKAVGAGINLMLPLGDMRARRARDWLLDGGLDTLYGTGSDARSGFYAG